MLNGVFDVKIDLINQIRIVTAISVTDAKESVMVVDNDFYLDPFWDAFMKFRLTYAGPLLSSGNENRAAKAPHKHEVRMAFHPQLKRLWEVTPFLKRGCSSYNGNTWAGVDVLPEPERMKGELAKKFQILPWNFIPLVTADMDFYCGLDILFLRNGTRKSILSQGDLDGRLKTLLDALSKPDSNQGYSARGPAKGSDNPLFVLLEDDRQITKISVETDILLEPLDAQKPEVYADNDVRLVINVSLAPVEPANWSMPYL